MTSRNSLLTALAFLLISSTVNAQSYTFSLIAPGTTLYENLVDPTEAQFDANGLDLLAELNDETFYFYDQEMNLGGTKKLSMGEGGFMRVENASSLMIIDGAFTWMEPIDETSSQSYKIEGDPGSLIIKTEYRNMKFTDGPDGNFLNVQIWAYQETGVVEIHYGPRSDNNASGYNTSNGPNVGMFWAPQNFSQCYEKLWINGDPNEPTTAEASNFVFHALQGLPDEGTVYRFTPTFTLGTTEAVPDALIIYPNPALDHVCVNKPNCQYAILDLSGVMQDHGTVEDETVMLNKLAAGIYILRLQDESATWYKRIQVQ